LGLLANFLPGGVQQKAGLAGLIRIVKSLIQDLQALIQNLPRAVASAVRGSGCPVESGRWIAESIH